MRLSDYELLTCADSKAYLEYAKQNHRKARVNGAEDLEIHTFFWLRVDGLDNSASAGSVGRRKRCVILGLAFALA